MPEPTSEDWYRLLTVALLAVGERPFPDVNGVALDQRGLTLLVEHDKEDIAGRVQERFGISPAIRTIGPIAPIAQGGDPVDHTPASARPGTLATLVKDANKTVYFLTCDHVVGHLAGQPVGAPVYSGRTQIGTFARGSLVSTMSGVQNRVDAALIELTNPSAHLAAVRSIGTVRGVNSAWAFGDRLDKFGTATRLTTGDYTYKVSHLVPYSSGNALFVDQIGIDSIRPSPFAQSGDSGSLVVDKNGDAGGLLFAAAVNSNLGFANPIGDVLQVLGVSLV
jgi:hypothetical protein